MWWGGGGHAGLVGLSDGLTAEFCFALRKVGVALLSDLGGEGQGIVRLPG